MKTTKYFNSKSEMTKFANEFSKQHPANWQIRTTLECDHRINERRKAIVLVSEETIIQRIIYCPICHTHGNSINVQPQKETI